VLSTLFVNGDLLSSPWALVIGIGLIYFLLQAVLCATFYALMGRQERAIQLLCHDFEQGGSGRDERELPANFVWIHWVLSIFPSDSPKAASNYSREDVLQELDTRISSNGDYILLQRLGVMAPLLGVVLTVAGFYWLKVGNDDQSLGGILLAVTPLVSGVGTGAVLALINQVLLHIAGRRVESLRMSVRTWFDKVIWSQSGRDAQVMDHAVQAVERYAGSVHDAAERFSDNSKLINESTAAMTEAASRFSEVVQSFTSKMEGVPEALQDVHQTTAASANAFEQLVGVGSRAVSNLDVSVAAFRTTLEREFAAAARLHRRSTRSLTDTVQQIASIAKTSAQLSEFVAQSITPATHQLAEFGETLADLKDVAGAIKSVNNVPSDGERLSGTLARAAEISDAISALPAQIRSVLKQDGQVDSGGDSAGSTGRSASRLPKQPR
jgi:uncharacterized protein YukE